MTYKVIQWATGNVGRHALRGIIERPDFELVGVFSYDPAKIGRDAGELVDRPPTGITVTNDKDAIVALDADCVSYNALGTTLDTLDPAVDDIAMLLASGKNVVTSAIDHFLYPKASSSSWGTEKLLARLEEVCVTGGTSLYQAGATPGFALDLWPITMTRIAQRIDRVTLTEIVDLSTYDSVSVLHGFMGFGRPPEPLAPFFTMMQDVENSAYYPAICMVCDALEADIDRVTFAHEFALTEEPYDSASGRFEVGTVSAARAGYTAWSGDRAIFELRFVWRNTDNVAPEWPTGDGRWILDVQGEPRIQTEVQVTTTYDSTRATSIMTAQAPVNAIPSVCAARPGVLTHLDLPVFGGGYTTAAGA
jgi:4-hydroxy-tetrahydrodipicolinate reductase